MVMKKTVILLILTLMMVVSGMCYAAGDGSDLNRQQKVADKFMAVLSGDAAAVTQLQVDMVPELAEKMTAANFAALVFRNRCVLRFMSGSTRATA